MCAFARAAVSGARGRCVPSRALAEGRLRDVVRVLAVRARSAVVAGRAAVAVGVGRVTTQLDADRLRAGLGRLQPACDYVTRLGAGEVSEVIGAGVDGRGRLRLHEEPPNGRFLVMGELWVTTTETGDAPDPDMLGEGRSFQFGPILNGGMDLAVFEDCLLGVCTSGSFIGGRVGVNARMPALL